MTTDNPITDELTSADASELPALTEEALEKVDNPALAGAMKRLQARAKELHNSHYTKHGSHSVKHSSW